MQIGLFPGSRRIAAIACLLLVAPMTWAASLNEQLAELGHENTRGCVIPSMDNGIGSLLTVQFKKHADSAENAREAVAILKLMAEGLVSAGHFYVGFRPTEAWQTCQRDDPDYLFWRDWEYNWRIVRKTPVRFLAQHEKTLAAELQGTPAEAFVRYSLGMVEWNLERTGAAVRNLETAWDILVSQRDPYGISVRVLVPLIEFHLGDGDDETRAQMLLHAYARTVGDSRTGDDYRPLIAPEPDYPRAAASARLEGYVLFEFTVTSEGKVVDPVVIEQDPPGVFDDAALEAMRGYRYLPRVIDGQPVDVMGARNRITFRLR